MIPAPGKTTIRLELTKGQQAQIRQATGRTVTALELRLEALPQPGADREGEVRTGDTPAT
jgi:hypothetical protein